MRIFCRASNVPKCNFPSFEKLSKMLFLNYSDGNRQLSLDIVTVCQKRHTLRSSTTPLPKVFLATKAKEKLFMTGSHKQIFLLLDFLFKVRTRNERTNDNKIIYSLKPEAATYLVECHEMWRQNFSRMYLHLMTIVPTEISMEPSKDYTSQGLIDYNSFN